MNFLLNKIDTDIRRKVYEETKEGKIHGKSEVLINKDSEKNRDKSFDKCLEREFNNRDNKNKSKKQDDIISVKGEIDVDIETQYCGNFLDIKK